MALSRRDSRHRQGRHAPLVRTWSAAPGLRTLTAYQQRKGLCRCITFTIVRCRGIGRLGLADIGRVLLVGVAVALDGTGSRICNRITDRIPHVANKRRFNAALLGNFAVAPLHPFFIVEHGRHCTALVLIRVAQHVVQRVEIDQRAHPLFFFVSRSGIKLVFDADPSAPHVD